MSAAQKDKMLNACSYGRVGEVQQLLKEAPSLLNASLNHIGYTPLHRASYNGKTEVVRLLLASNADPNKQDKNCWTPLHFASHYGYTELVRELLASNADPNIQSTYGTKPGGSFGSWLEAATIQEIQELLDNERKKRKEAQQQKSTTSSSSSRSISSSAASSSLVLSGYPPQQHQSLGNFPPQQPPSYQQSPAYSQQPPSPYQHSMYASPQQQSPSQYSQQQPPSPYHYQQQSPSPYQQPRFAYPQQQSPSHYPQQQPPSPYQQQPPSTSTSPSTLSSPSSSASSSSSSTFGSTHNTPSTLGSPSHSNTSSSPSPFSPLIGSTPTSSSSPSPASSSSPQNSSRTRTDDVAKEDLNNSLPIKGVWDKPLLSFEEAVQIANVPTLDIDDVYSCLEHFEDVEHPPPGLTIDEACAVRFYTMETPFYGAFNSALRTRDRNEAKCFFPFLQLLLLAMHKLPKSNGILFRGTRNLPVDVIDEYKRKAETKKCVFWGACSSTTTSVKTLSNPMFCGKKGNRVKFVIQDCDLGVSIQALSAIGVEKEVLLPPCLRFVVEDYVDLGNGLLEFQLRYSAPRREVIPLVPPPQFLSSPGASRRGAAGGATCRALYNFTNGKKGALCFTAGAIITILDDSDSAGWWKGELNGVQGYFSFNYVARC